MWKSKLKPRDTLQIGDVTIVVTDIKDGVVSIGVNTPEKSEIKKNANTMENSVIGHKNFRTQE